MTGGAASLAPAGVHRGPIAFSGGGAASALLIAFGCGAVAFSSGESMGFIGAAGSLLIVCGCARRGAVLAGGS